MANIAPTKNVLINQLSIFFGEPSIQVLANFVIGLSDLFMPSDSRKYTYHVLLLPSIHRGRN